MDTVAVCFSRLASYEHQYVVANERPFLWSDMIADRNKSDDKTQHFYGRL